MGTNKYIVHGRWGWGWEVRRDSFQSHPIESAIAAQELADGLNSGLEFGQACARAKLTFRNGRGYPAGTRDTH